MKNKPNINANGKEQKVSASIRMDTATQAMLDDVIRTDNRSRSNAMVILARIGYKYWKKHRKNVSCI